MFVWFVVKILKLISVVHGVPEFHFYGMYAIVVHKCF